MFDYYILGAYTYLVLVILLLIGAIFQARNRTLYIKYLIGGPWYIGLLRLIALFGLTALSLTTSAIIGCFVITCLIQAMVRHHYNYLNHLYQAQESVVLPYDPQSDRQRLEIEV
jgi:hypothetical protein